MPSKPTTRQLNYLRSLATRTGQTFTYPKTRQQASAAINRLKHTRPSSRSEVRIDGKPIADQIQAGPIDAARVREHLRPRQQLSVVALDARRLGRCERTCWQRPGPSIDRGRDGVARNERDRC